MYKNIHGSRVYLANLWSAIPVEDQNKLLVPNLSPLQATDLVRILQDDAEKYYYSALVSFSEALRGCSYSSWSWAIIKLYYSAYFSARSLLALEKHSVCFIGKSEKFIEAVPNASLMSFPKKKEINSQGGNDRKVVSGTHGAVICLFEKIFQNVLIMSQEIDQLYPFEWLVRERETVNYRADYFKDPAAPFCMQKAESLGVETLLPNFYTDSSHLFTFDNSYSIISYPLELLKYTRDQLVIKNQNNFLVPHNQNRKLFIEQLLNHLPICLGVVSNLYR